jgi:hypothetical protein
MRLINSPQIKDLSTLLKAGKGITYNTYSGTISSKISSENFNTYIDGTQYYTIGANLTSTIVLAGGSQNSRYILRSMHITNISGNKAYLYSNVVYASGNTAVMANLIQLPVGQSMEMIQRPQILSPGDVIYIQGLNNLLTPNNAILSATFTYEGIYDDQGYIGSGVTIPRSNVNTQIVDSGTTALIFESIKVVNITSDPVNFTSYVSWANGSPRGYYTYNLPIPANSTVEVIDRSKYVQLGDKIYASYVSPYGSNNGVSVFSSYRQTESTTLLSSPSTTEFNRQMYFAFDTSILEGTTLYWTLEE